MFLDYLLGDKDIAPLATRVINVRVDVIYIFSAPPAY